MKIDNKTKGERKEVCLINESDMIAVQWRVNTLPFEEDVGI